MSAVDLAALRALAERAKMPNGYVNTAWWDMHEMLTTDAILTLIEAAERVPALEAENARLREALAEAANALQAAGHFNYAAPGKPMQAAASTLKRARAVLEPRS